MKKLILATFAVTLLGASAANAAIVVRLGTHGHHHHRHQVCAWHHHHRVCHWR